MLFVKQYLICIQTGENAENEDNLDFVFHGDCTRNSYLFFKKKICVLKSLKAMNLFSVFLCRFRRRRDNLFNTVKKINCLIKLSVCGRRNWIFSSAFYLIDIWCSNYTANLRSFKCSGTSFFFFFFKKKKKKKKLSNLQV